MGSIHSDWLSGSSQVIDKRPWFLPSKPFHLAQCTREDSSRVLAGDIPSGEHEGLHFRGLQGEALKLPVADALVAGEHDPAVAPGFGKPGLVRRASGEPVGEPLDFSACFAQGVDDGNAVERLVDEERYRLKRP